MDNNKLLNDHGSAGTMGLVPGTNQDSRIMDPISEKNSVNKQSK